MLDSASVMEDLVRRKEHGVSELKERLVAPSVVADYLDVSPGQLAQMRYLGTGPVYIKIGSRVRYRLSEVATWLDAHTQTQTGVVGSS